MPIFMRYDGVDGRVDPAALPQHADGGGAINQFSWGLDRVDQSAPGSFFDGRFLRGVDLAASADDPGFIGGVFVGSVPHVKSIDIDATAPSFDRSQSGEDVLIGGTTGYDASPIGTGDLADWRANYGSGGTASAAIYKMHLIGHTTAGPAAADGNSDLSMTTVADGGMNILLGDGSVRDISPRDAAFFAYDQGFPGGVFVAAGDSGRGLEALVFEGDRYDPLCEQAIGGLSVAVADIEGKGPHMLMTAGFMF